MKSATHPLNNVIWNALTTRQAEFAESCGQARRFIPEITSLSGFSDPTPECYQSLAGLLTSRGTIALFLDEPYQPQSGWGLVAAAPLLQMVCEGGDDAASCDPADH